MPIFNLGVCFYVPGFWKFLNIFQILHSGAYLFSDTRPGHLPSPLGSAFTLHSALAPLTAPGPNPPRSSPPFTSLPVPVTRESLCQSRGRGASALGFLERCGFCCYVRVSGPLSADVCTRCEQRSDVALWRGFPAPAGERGHFPMKGSQRCFHRPPDLTREA